MPDISIDVDNLSEVHQRAIAPSDSVCREHYVTGSPVTGSTEKLYLQICVPL